MKDKERNTGQTKPQQAAPVFEKRRTEECIEMKLISPLAGFFIPADSRGEPREDDARPLNGRGLAAYEDEIRDQVDQINQPEIEGGTPFDPMEDYAGSPSLSEKTVGAVISVEKIEGALYACTTLLLKEPFTPWELEELYDHISGQYCEGWGEVMEQRDIPVEGGYISVQFSHKWEIDFLIQMKPVEVSILVKQKVKPEPVYPDPTKPRLKLRVYIQEGNVYSVLPGAMQLLIKNGRREEAEGMYARITEAGNRFQKILGIIREYVEIEPIGIREKQKLEKQRQGKGPCR